MGTPTPDTEAPVERDGYATAFYEIADMLGIPAQAKSPAAVWRDEMRPKLATLAKAEADIQAAVAALESVGAIVHDAGNDAASRMALGKVNVIDAAILGLCQKVAAAIRSPRTTEQGG